MSRFVLVQATRGNPRTDYPIRPANEANKVPESQSQSRILMRKYGMVVS